MAGERTERATPHKQRDARRKGQVARSREVDSALAMLAAFLVLKLVGGMMWEQLASLLTDAFAHLNDPVNTELVGKMGSALMGRAVLILMPLLLAVLVVATLGGMAQTGGPLFALDAVKPQFKRLNPITGGKRLIASKQAYVSLAKTLLKFAVFGAVAAMTLQAHWDELASLGIGADIVTSTKTLVTIAFDLATKVLIALAVVAAADYLFQRYDMGHELRMTLQEVKDEYRQNEGDPLVKAQLARARRSLLARAMQNVPKADVVIVNPTHFAVALKYDPTSSRAPVVLAKGTQLMAQRIRELAEEHRIPVIQNAPLCRAIYKAVRIGQEIPPDLYEAVAQILAFVYRLRAGGVRRAAAPSGVTA